MDTVLDLIDISKDFECGVSSIRVMVKPEISTIEDQEADYTWMI